MQINELMELQFRLKMSQYPGSIWNPKGKPKTEWMPPGAWETYDAFQKRIMPDYHLARRRGVKAVAEFMGLPEAEAVKMRIRYLSNSINPKDKRELHYLSRGEERGDKITPEMLDIAKAFPVDKLIDFVNGKALAFCHPDKTPSLTIYRKMNKARCHVCNKSFSTIDILVERDSLSFAEAVRRLQ